MLKYLGIGFLFSGILTLRAILAPITSVYTFLPDPGLLIVLLYGIRGRGTMLVPLCLLLGFIQGAAGIAPAGFYILAYLCIGAFLIRTGTLFFTHHPVTLLFLAFFMVFFYGLFFAVAQAVGLVESMAAGAAKQQVWIYLSTAVLTVALLTIGNRFFRLRKRVSV